MKESNENRVAWLLNGYVNNFLSGHHREILISLALLAAFVEQCKLQTEFEMFMNGMNFNEIDILAVAPTSEKAPRPEPQQGGYDILEALQFVYGRDGGERMLDKFLGCDIAAMRRNVERLEILKDRMIEEKNHENAVRVIEMREAKKAKIADLVRRRFESPDRNLGYLLEDLAEHFGPDATYGAA